jgi:hypothetical protein
VVHFRGGVTFLEGSGISLSDQTSPPSPSIWLEKETRLATSLGDSRRRRDGALDPMNEMNDPLSLMMEMGNEPRDLSDNTAVRMTRQDKTRQDKTRQDKTRQDKTREDKTRQDQTRQDNARQHKSMQDNKR